MKQILVVVFICIANHVFAQLDENGKLNIAMAGTVKGKSPGVVLNINNHDFMYDGEYVNHYGFGFHGYQDKSTSYTNPVNSYVSGHFGVDFFTAGQHRMRISRDGEVSIGTAERQPGYLLNVDGKSIFHNTVEVMGDARVSNHLHVEGGRIFAYRESDNWGVVYAKHFDSPENQTLYLNYYGTGATIIGNGGGNVTVANKLTINKAAKINGRLSILSWYNTSVGHTHSSFVMNGERADGQWHLYGDGARSSIGVITTDISGNMRFITHHDPDFDHGKTLTDEELITDNTKLFISSGGRVGIGTSTPKNELSVEGTIWAQEVKVSLTDGADWVFEEDYDLRTLEEVEAFISENKHLPEIPSAEEFRQNDLNVAEMDNKLLQKIEELTLYLIEQNKQLKEQQAEIETLKKMNLQLLKKIEDR